MYRFRRAPGDDDGYSDLKAWRDDIMVKAYANNEMRGTAADETLIGTDGPDAICGEGGNDVMIGGRGNDFIEGCWGDDKIWTGPGTDILQEYVYESHDELWDFQNGKDRVEFAFVGLTADDVNIAYDGRAHAIVTIDGHPEFQLDVFGRGFGYEDCLYTNYVGYVG